MNKVIAGIIVGLAAVIGVLVIAAGLSLLSGFIAWLIWNGSVRYTLGLPALGFWQVFFLNYLVAIVGAHFKASISSK